MEDDYKTFDFHRQKIISFCNALPKTEDKIDYLKWIVCEIYNCPEISDYPVEVKIDARGNPYDEIRIIDVVRNKIEFYESRLEREKSTLKDSEKNKMTEQIKIEKFKWNGTQVQLAYLFRKLYDSSLIKNVLNPQDVEWTKIANYFEKKNGKSFDNKNLSVALGNLKHNKNDKPKGSDVLEEIVNDTKSIE